jgi:hypothetical protein
MKLIKEQAQQVEVITEAEEGGRKSYFIEGIFMQADKPNKNRRKYVFESLNREVDRYRREYIDENRAFGELGHPDTPTINYPLVSHMIKVLRAEGRDFYGKAKILGGPTGTPNGKIVECLLSEGAKLGVSTRGLGTVIQGSDGISLVQDDFQLATAADIVADPSAPDAFVRGIMESREWVFVDGRYMSEDIEVARKAIVAAPSRRLNETCVRLFADFMRRL